MGIESCIGAKHSSLSRRLEWDRLAARDRVRPEFRVFTGNDLAIDMVMYGSDYLLGLSTFAPEAFALRDRMWANEDPRFHELNDLLQYLGHFTFRAPVPGYRHDAAMCFELRGWASSSNTPSGVPQRPELGSCGARRHRRTDRRLDIGRGQEERHERALDAGEEARHRRRVPRALRVARHRHPDRRRRRSGRGARGAGRDQRRNGRHDRRHRTGSRCCRWRAGTARPTAGRPTSCGGGGGASVPAAAASCGARRPPSEPTGVPTRIS